MAQEQHTTAKAIETEYKGYRFRSRLEARWAVFFDEVRIAWEYEVEGYELSNGIKYLPDFYLPQFQLFVEIKPLITQEPDWKEKVVKWEDKCRQYRTDTGNAILIVYGDPATDIWGRLFAWVADDLVMPTLGKIKEYEGNSRFIPVGEWTRPDVVLLTADTEHDHICISQDGKANKKVTNPMMMVFDYWDDAYSLLIKPMTDDFCEISSNTDGTFDNARKKARQARFEYGESGYRKPKRKENNQTGAKGPLWLKENEWWPSDDWGKFADYMHSQRKDTQYIQQTQNIIHTYRWKIKELMNLATLDMYEEHGFTASGEWSRKPWCDEMMEAGAITKIDGVYDFNEFRCVEYMEEKQRLQGENMVIQCT